MSSRTTRNTKRPTRTRAPKPAPAQVPAKPPYARGNPLTHSVTFTDTRGTCWLVYVEPAPPPPALWPNAVVLPGRRLRFDSVDASVMVAPFPAGSPFLHDRALQDLLDQAQPPASDPAAGPLPRFRSPAAIVPDLPPPEPVREQLATLVHARSGTGFQLSRLAQPFALALMVIKDLILPRGRG